MLEDKKMQLQKHHIFLKKVQYIHIIYIYIVHKWTDYKNNSNFYQKFVEYNFVLWEKHRQSNIVMDEVINNKIFICKLKLIVKLFVIQLQIFFSS